MHANITRRLALAVLLLVGCGDDGSAEGSTTASSTTAATSTSTTSTTSVGSTSTPTTGTTAASTTIDGTDTTDSTSTTAAVDSTTGPEPGTSGSTTEPGTTTGSACAAEPTCEACRDCVTDVGGPCQVEAAACMGDFDCGGLFECCGDAPDTCMTCCNKLGTPPSIELLQAWDACVVAECPPCAPLSCG